MTREERNEHLAPLMNAISAIMDERGITQAQLARRVGTDRAAINKMLTLTVDPRMSTLLAILKALDCHWSMANGGSDGNTESVA